MDPRYNINGGFKPTIKRSADIDGPDFFPTPQWATQVLIDVEDFQGDIWECACGNGAMSDVLKQTGNEVYSSDLYDRGYGDSGVDFLTAPKRFKNIVTNPPYNSAEGFVKAGLDKSDEKLALLLRLAFLEGAGRNKSIFSKNPPSRVWVFSERITFYPIGAEIRGSGTTAYAWFIWDKKSSSNTELHWLPVGYKKKFK